MVIARQLFTTENASKMLMSVSIKFKLKSLKFLLLPQGSLRPLPEHSWQWPEQTPLPEPGSWSWLCCASPARPRRPRPGWPCWGQWRGWTSTGWGSDPSSWPSLEANLCPPDNWPPEELCWLNGSEELFHTRSKKFPLKLFFKPSSFLPAPGKDQALLLPAWRRLCLVCQ